MRAFVVLFSAAALTLIVAGLVESGHPKLGSGVLIVGFFTILLGSMGGKRKAGSQQPLANPLTPSESAPEARKEKISTSLGNLHSDKPKESADLSVSARQSASSFGISVLVDTKSHPIAKVSTNPNETFINAGGSASVQGVNVGDLVYIGTEPEHRFSSQPSVLYTKQKVAFNSLSEPLSYWPSYSELTPEQRGRYLAWLQEGRGRIDELGYVFLFFYGLERYVLRDAVEDLPKARHSNLCAIIEEVLRLRELFADNRSFDTYSNQLLDLIYILHWPHRVDDRRGAFPDNQSAIGKYVVAKYANAEPEKAIDADWALHWLLAYGPVKRTKVVRENYPLLRAIFRSFYEREAGGGITVPTCKKKLDIWINPASRGLNDVSRLPTPDTWCDPTELKRPMSKLVAIFEQAIPVVRSLARAIAKEDKVLLLSSWPRSIPTDRFPQLDRIVRSIQDFLVTHPSPRVTALGCVLGLDFSEKVSVSQLRQLASAVSCCGHALAPDPDLTPVALKPNDTLQVYKGNRISALSTEGQRIALTLQLGSLLAMADDDIHDREVEALTRLVQSLPNHEEQQYLLAYLDWRLSHSPSTAGLKKQIDVLSDDQRAEVGQQLVQLALADGELPSAEIKQLEKLFGRLGLDSQQVTHYLHSSATQPVPGQTPTQTQSTTSNTDSGLVLDEMALQAHKASTEEIQTVLHRIFGEDEDERATAETSAPPESESDHWHDGLLDEEHHLLAEWLMTKEEWSMDEITSKCSELGLLPDGALEQINNVAFDVLGDGLLELGDPVEVYLDVLPA